MADTIPLRLHGYWRSTASYRVRIALNFKHVSYEQVPHDLRAGEQRSADFLALNPQGLVPALEGPGLVIPQSGAIIEWLEETFPQPPLLPTNLRDRAIVRAMALIVACDIHPLNNLRILKSLKHDLDADQTDIDAWIVRWINQGFAALEAMIASHGRGFAFGDTPTLADCYLVPQVYSAQRYSVDVSPFPAIIAASDRAAALPEFAAAHPSAQPDADPD